MLAPTFHHYVAGTADDGGAAERPAGPGAPVRRANGLDSLRRQYSRPIYVLMTMVGLILLVACSNIASLLLGARRGAAARDRRASRHRRKPRPHRPPAADREPGAWRRIGGALGIAVAWWGIGVLTSLLSNGRENFTLHAELNWTVLGVTLALSLATGVLFGLTPALQATRLEIVPAFKEVRAERMRPRRRFGRVWAGRSSSRRSRCPGAAGRRRAVRPLALAAAEHRAGIRSRQRAAVHHPAVERRLSGSRAHRGCSRRFANDLEPAARASRTSVSRSRPLPMGGGTITPVAHSPVPGRQAPTGRRKRSSRRSGRILQDDADARCDRTRFLAIGMSAGAPKVVVVNRRSGASRSVSRIPSAGRSTLGDDSFEIVGVVDDALTIRAEGRGPCRRVFPIPAGDRRPPGQMTYEVRTVARPIALAAAVRAQTMRQADPGSRSTTSRLRPRTSIRRSAPKSRWRGCARRSRCSRC